MEPQKHSFNLAREDLYLIQIHPQSSYINKYIHAKMEKNNHRITHTNVMWLYIISEDNGLRMSTESPIMPKELLRYSRRAVKGHQISQTNVNIWKEIIQIGIVSVLYTNIKIIVTVVYTTYLKGEIR